MSRSRLPSSRTRLSRRLITYDVVCAVFAPAIAFWIRDPALLDRADGWSIAFYCGASAIVSILSFISFRISHGLPQFFSVKDASEIVKASFSSVAIISALMFTFTRLEEVPRSVPIIHFFVLAAALIGGRVWRRTIVHRRDLGSAKWLKADVEKAILLVGVSRLAWFYMRLLDTFAHGRRHVVGLLDANAGLVGRTMYGQIVLGRPQDADDLLNDLAAHGVTVAELVICDQRPEIVEIYRQMLKDTCEARGIALTDLADELGLSEITQPEPSTLTEVRVPIYLSLRPYADSVLSGIALIALSPIMLVVAFAVYLNLGSPVLFWQRRLGRFGYPIFVYKFRSMRNPVNRKGRSLSDGERSSGLGDFLRVTRLDELPQLYNVARGDMAIIGPRPLLPHDQPDNADARLSAVPGITGWAQVHGGKLIGVAEKNDMDTYYVTHACLALDLRIILATIKTIVNGDRLQNPANADEGH